jgi:hypothetical protein
VQINPKQRPPACGRWTNAFRPRLGLPRATAQPTVSIRHSSCDRRRGHSPVGCGRERDIINTAYMPESSAHRIAEDRTVHMYVCSVCTYVPVHRTGRATGSHRGGVVRKGSTQGVHPRLAGWMMRGRRMRDVIKPAARLPGRGGKPNPPSVHLLGYY